MADIDREKLTALLTDLMSNLSEGRESFRIYRRVTRRKVRGKPVYRFYVQFLDERTGEYATAVSSKQTTRSAATTWAITELARRKAAALTQAEHGVTVGELARDFFNEDSAYMTRRQERGKAMSWNHRRHCATYLQKYILPFFGDHRLDRLTDDHIEAFQSWLLKQPRGKRVEGTLAPATANHIVIAFRHVVKWAIKKKILTHDPFLTIEPLVGTPKKRGSFEPEEVQRLFLLDLTAWNGDPLARLLHATAAASGMRKGELQGLQRQAVKEIRRPDGSVLVALLITSSWERSGRLKGTKSGNSRRRPSSSAPATR